MSCREPSTPRAVAPAPLDRVAITQALALLAETQSAFTSSFYQRFFEAHPEVVPLFGVHSDSEREEMMNETLNSLVAWCDEEPWLQANLEAMGASHWEYGVTSEMYDAFRDVFLECAREHPVLAWSATLAAVLEAAIDAICRVMREAGERAEARAAERSRDPGPRAP